MNSKSFEERLSSYLKNKKLFSKSNTLIIACSGGVDSMVSAFLLHKLGYSIELAHCNFSLRGGESDQDESFVEDAAQEWSVPFHHKKFSTKEFASEKGISIQMAARELRYDWFEKLLSTNNTTLLVTAHHSDDQLETVIFNTVKGGGIAGFHGILPKRDRIVRPLLWATKNDIVDYAQQQGISWREDKSNQSVDYARNKIRHEVVPILKELNANINSVISHTTERILSTEALLDSLLGDFKKNYTTRNLQLFQVSISGLKKYSYNSVLLYELLKAFGFNYSQALQLGTTVRNNSIGKLFYSDSHQLLIDRESIIIEAIKEKENERFFLLESDFEKNENGLMLSIKKEKAESYSLVKQQKFAELDYNKLRFPLTIRKWESGDKFSPVGMKGKKLVSDFLTDLKIDRFEKEKVNVLLSGNDIVWVIGFRINHFYRITDTTKFVYQIQLN